MSFTYQYPHPAVSTDVVVFTIDEERLKILLIKRANDPYKDSWAVPGGFVEIDEDLETAAKRELAEETGVTEAFLEQLYTFGKPQRDPRERVISVAYYALVQFDKVSPRAASDAKDVAWFAVDELPELAFDHQHIIAMAVKRLAAKVEYSTIAFQFMPAEFTLSEVQQVYEIIQNRTIDKRNFRKWVLALDQVEDTGKDRNGSHRPARLYRLKTPGEIQLIR